MLITSGVGVLVNIIMGCSLHQHGHAHGPGYTRDKFNIKKIFRHYSIPIEHQTSNVYHLITVVLSRIDGTSQPNCDYFIQVENLIIYSNYNVLRTLFYIIIWFSVTYFHKA